MIKDKVAKEKEALAKVVGAKDAMSSLIDRTKTLENTLGTTLKSIQTLISRVDCGLYVQVYRSGRTEYITVKQYLEEMVIEINKVA